MSDYADADTVSPMNPVEIIPGRPEQGGAELADLIWTVDPHLMQYLCNDEAGWRRLFLADWPQENGFVNHSHADLAILDDRIVGVMISHDAASIEERIQLSMARWKETEESAFFVYLEQALDDMDRLFPHPPDSAWYVLDLAVDSRVRKAGIGRRLMEHAEFKARRSGRTALHLDVVADNPAVNFYKRIGMHIAVETLLPELEENHGVGLHYHMVKPLA